MSRKILLSFFLATTTIFVLGIVVFVRLMPPQDVQGHPGDPVQSVQDVNAGSMLSDAALAKSPRKDGQLERFTAQLDSMSLERSGNDGDIEEESLDSFDDLVSAYHRGEVGGSEVMGVSNAFWLLCDSSRGLESQFGSTYGDVDYFMQARDEICSSYYKSEMPFTDEVDYLLRADPSEDYYRALEYFDAETSDPDFNAAERYAQLLSETEDPFAIMHSMARLSSVARASGRVPFFHPENSPYLSQEDYIMAVALAGQLLACHEYPWLCGVDGIWTLAECAQYGICRPRQTFMDVISYVNSPMVLDVAIGMATEVYRMRYSP